MHKHIFVFSVVFLSNLATSAVAQTPSTSSLGSANERVIRSLFAAFNRHDVEGLAALYAPDAYLMSSDFSEPRHGPDGVRKTYSELFSQLPQIHDEVRTLIIKGDEAAVEFVSTWAAKGNMPAGQLPIATFFKFKEGKIISDTSYFKP
jgi:ketosteroid isomerase-like protein